MNAKTIEGYKIPSLTKSAIDDTYFGHVLNPNLDDRFSIPVFCIWNSKGNTIYIENKKVEDTERYALILNQTPHI